MNIFYLDADPVECAKAHGDKHIVKMPLETAQMLSTVWHRFGDSDEIKASIYKITHTMHPCTQWVATNTSTYEWTVRLYIALCKEYEYRRGRIHASYALSKFLSIVPGGLSGGSFVAPPLCMPDEYAIQAAPFAGQASEKSRSESVCQAYRKYYQYKFDAGIAQYNWKRSKPDWIESR